MESIFLHTEHYTPLSKETLRLVKIASDLNDLYELASDLNDLYEQQPSAELKEQVDAAVKAAENAYKIADADLKQRNAGRCLLSETEPINGTVTYDYETGIVHIIN
jgi:hypothetical protein